MIKLQRYPLVIYIINCWINFVVYKDNYLVPSSTNRWSTYPQVLVSHHPLPLSLLLTHLPTSSCRSTSSSLLPCDFSVSYWPIQSVEDNQRVARVIYGENSIVLLKPSNCLCTLSIMCGLNQKGPRGDFVITFFTLHTKYFSLRSSRHNTIRGNTQTKTGLHFVYFLFLRELIHF